MPSQRLLPNAADIDRASAQRVQRLTERGAALSYRTWPLLSNVGLLILEHFDELLP